MNKPIQMNRRYTFYEFFAGGGMARLGLGERWACLFANEWCPKKAASYVSFFGSNPEPKVEDTGKLTTADLPYRADLALASFPCQHLPLAGNCTGLKNKCVGTFWPLWRFMEGLVEQGRPITMVIPENVCGALTSHGEKDFAKIGSEPVGGGYRFGAMGRDAVRFASKTRVRGLSGQPRC